MFRNCTGFYIKIMYARIANLICIDPHYFRKLNPDPQRVKSWIQICIRVKNQKLLEVQNGATKCRGCVEPLKVCRPLVADWYHFDEEQDSGPYLIEKSDPGSALKWKEESGSTFNGKDPPGTLIYTESVPCESWLRIKSGSEVASTETN